MIVSQLLNLGSSIWRARAQTYGSFLGASALNGFAAGPSETLQPAIIAGGCHHPLPAQIVGTILADGHFPQTSSFFTIEAHGIHYTSSLTSAASSSAPLWQVQCRMRWDGATSGGSTLHWSR